MGRGLEMDGAGKAVQVLMFIANFILWCGSIVILVFGILALANRPYLEHILGQTIYASAAGILIAVGVVGFIVSFLGCFGALKEIKCMLLTYFIIVLILFVVLLIGGTLGLVFRGKAEDNIKNGMKQSLRNYQDGIDEPITNAWDDAQRSMNCCGVTHAKDWLENRGFDFSRKKAPASCCRRNEDGTRFLDCERQEHNMWQEPCYFKARAYARQHAVWIGAAGITVSLLMIFGLVFAIILFNMIK